jgi:hypothetical protein
MLSWVQLNMTCECSRIAVFEAVVRILVSIKSYLLFIQCPPIGGRVSLLIGARSPRSGALALFFCGQDKDR